MCYGEGYQNRFHTGRKDPSLNPDPSRLAIGPFLIYPYLGQEERMKDCAIRQVSVCVTLSGEENIRGERPGDTASGVVNVTTRAPACQKLFISLSLPGQEGDIFD